MSRADLVPFGRPDCPSCRGSGREIADSLPGGRRFIADSISERGRVVIECSCVGLWGQTLRSLGMQMLDCALCQGSGWVHGREGMPSYDQAVLLVPTASGHIVPCSCRIHAVGRQYRDFSEPDREIEHLF